ncbi:MAG: VCBS repeat-containing protein [Nitrospirae bacterium]|nr:VCBS repeat-containing protein [Candidatus Manganitrophaceae bacterium]
MKYWLRQMIPFVLLLSACSSDPFPDCCISQGDERDAPFSTTYLFQFKTGSSDIVAPDPAQFLRIITQADILTLKNSASTNQLNQNGLISGVIQGPQGPASEAALQVTDAEGNVIGRIGGEDRNLYYNSLGRVPDFIVDQGTSSEGTFTLFNAPPGETFFQLTRGGRGNGRITSFAGAVSIGQIDVLPVFPARIGVLGSVVEPVTGANIAGAAASFFGRESIEKSNDAGIVLLSADQGLPTNGDFLVRLSAPGYRETVHRFATPMDAVNSRQQAFDPLTDDNMKLYSEGTLQGLAKSAGVPLLATTNVIVGRIDPGQSGVVITPTGTDPSSLGKVFYFDTTGKLDPTLTATTDQSGFILFPNCASNPGGALFLNAAGISIDPDKQTKVFSTGRTVVYCRPGGAFVQTIIMGPLAAGSASFTVPVNGTVTDEGSQTVKDAGIQLIGSALFLNLSGDNGLFTIQPTLSEDPTAIAPLLGNSNYTVKVSKDTYLPTYQPLSTGPAGGKRDLLLLTAAGAARLCPPAGRGMLYGTVHDLGLIDPTKQGRATAGISLAAFKESGEGVGRVVYLDLAGNPIAGTTTSDGGRYVVCDLPVSANTPTLFQLRVTSPEDSGAFLTTVYPDGATLLDPVVNKALPSQISVTGGVQSLAGPEGAAAVGDVRISVLGKGPQLTTDPAGKFALSLESNSKFILRAERDGYLPAYNYQVETHARSGVGVQAPLWTLSQGDLTALAQQAGLSPPLQGGTVAGQVLVPGFETNDPPKSPFATLDAPAQSLRIGFFNDDAQIDLLAVSSTGTVTILHGTGPGTFSPAPPFQLKVGTANLPSVQAAEVGDYNGDGQVDLIILSNKKIFIFLGDRAGGFNAGAEIPLPVPNTAAAFTIADITGDGFLDILVATEGDPSLVRLLNRGDGSFELFRAASGVLDPTGTCGATPNGIAVRQVGLSIVDVIISDPVKGLCDLTFNADGAALAPKYLTLPTPATYKGVKAVFLDSDEIPDLIALHSGGGAFFLGPPPNDPTGTLQPAFDLPAGFDPVDMVATDVNRDKRIDLILAGAGGAYFLSGNGNGTFGGGKRLSTAPSGRLAAGDIDDDGRSDLIFAGTDKSLRLLLGADQPQAGVRMEARNTAGDLVGTPAYLNSAGQMVPGATATTDSGRFIFFNVPEGFTHLSVAEGGSGNALVTSHAGGLSYTHLNVNPIPPTTVLLAGQVINPTAGDLAGISVVGIKINSVGTPAATVSGDNGNYQFRLEANSEHLLKLDP